LVSCSVASEIGDANAGANHEPAARPSGGDADAADDDDVDAKSELARGIGMGADSQVVAAGVVSTASPVALPISSADGPAALKAVAVASSAAPLLAECFSEMRRA
jgi:hypothetical protein